MEKNSDTPINPKKYSCNGLIKIHVKNLKTKKKFLQLENSPPPPITFLMVRPLATGSRRGRDSNRIASPNSQEPKLIHAR